MLSGKYKTIADGDLISQYKTTGNLSVLGELYSRYTSLVYGTCLKYLKNREESQDAVMQIFEKLVSALKEHEVTHFKSWLYILTRNYCFMQLRSANGKTFEEISPMLMENGSVVHLDEEQTIETNIGILERCIEELGIEQKWCVQLFYLQQKCYKEIVEVTGYNDNKVKSHIQNGKRNLKICMERNG